MLNSLTLSDADSVVGMETQLEEGWEAGSASSKSQTCVQDHESVTSLFIIYL